MKKNILLFAFLLIVSITANAQKINWMTFDEALAAQDKNPKKIMMDVYTNWCGPCKMLDKNTFGNKDVINYVNQNYYAVKFNAEGNEVVTFNNKTFSNPNYKAELKNRRNSTHQLSRYLNVSAYPTVVFFDEDSKVIAPIRGYQRPQQIELYLKMFSTDKYKELSTQEAFNDYAETFNPEFGM